MDGGAQAHLLEHGGLVVEQVRDDLVAPIRSVASPMRLSATPASYRAPPPALGQDTEAVLQEQLGLSAEEVAGLKARGVV